MGFSIAEGPDIETDYYNFTALNFPEGHPAREMHDTFFFSPMSKGERKVLRTHTSPVQIRTMERRSRRSASSSPARPTARIRTPPTRRCSTRSRAWSSTRRPTSPTCRWVLEEFCKAFFEVPTASTMRFRPSFFPFTEPSFEVDIQCDRSRPAIVTFGEGTDWMEILGCGMVHPNVLRAGGLDPDEYQGFAWGMGLDRIAMLKYGMPDLRAFFDADVRWLSHYGFRPLDMPTLFGGLSELNMLRPLGRLSVAVVSICGGRSRRTGVAPWCFRLGYKLPRQDRGMRRFAMWRAPRWLVGSRTNVCRRVRPARPIEGMR